MNYRFKQTEIDRMKKSILSSCENETTIDENGNKSAWRMRLCLEGLAYCCPTNKQEQKRRIRELYLYEILTHKDMPNFENIVNL